MKVYPPLIHMNGTGATHFTKNLEEAAHHLRIAHERLMNVTPHMRDYYPQEDGTEKHRLAALTHGIRISRLDKTIDEIEALRHAILDQVNP